MSKFRIKLRSTTFVIATLTVATSMAVGCQDQIKLPKTKLQQDKSQQSKATTQQTQSTETELESATKKMVAELPPEQTFETPQVNRTKQTIEIPKSWKRLGKEDEIWIDTQAKEVIIAGHVCLTQGGLEMFICPEGTKEHESVIAAHAQSHQVHASLIKLDAGPGKSTSWDPEYRAAYGPSIDVTLKWQDAESKQMKTMPAKDWIRNFKTKKAMTETWVFGGSEFWKDPDTGEQIYYGDSGEMICLSNFSTATIDVNVESSQANAGLLYEAFTENIPPVGTKVYAIIKPGKRIEPEKKKEPSPSAADGTDKPPTPKDSSDAVNVDK